MTRTRTTRESYADHIRYAILSGHNATGEKMSIRELARRVDLSYEQIRKIYMGHPVVSDESNAKICKVLGLDQAKMWKIALEEKFSRRYVVGRLPDELPATVGGKMSALWEQLSPELRERVYRYAELMHEEFVAEQRRQKRTGTHR